MAQTKIKLIADGVIDVNNLAAGHTITTDNIGEGSNLYYTNARVASYLATGGNIGIGTSSADQLLHVEKSNAGSGVELLVVNSGANQSGTYSQIGVGTGGDATGTSYLRLYRDGSGISEFKGYNIQTFLVGGSERMRIDASGNVGIGTTSPEAKLDVKSGALIIDTVANNYGGLKIDDDSTGDYNVNFRAGRGGSSSGFRWFLNARPLTSGAFATGNERMALTNTGLGIGTSSPAKKLHVNLSAGTPDTQFIRLSNNYTNYPTANSTSTGIQFTFYNNTYGNDQTSAEIIAESPNSYFENSNIIFKTESSGTLAERVRIQSGGGISFNGDTAAANALDDYEEGTWTPYYISASGTITSNGWSSGKYTKIGRTVYIFGYVSYESNSAASGGITVGGLPFVAGSGFGQGSNRSGGVNSIGNYGFISNTPEFGNIHAGTSYIVPLSPANGAGSGFTQLQFSDFNATSNYSQFVFVGQYQV